MPTYATAAEVAARLPGLVIDDAAGFDVLLGRAERDVDRLLGPRPILDATGLKLDLAKLKAWEASAVKDAVAAQVEYLIAIAPDDKYVVGRLPSLVSGPDFQVSYGSGGDTARIGPRVMDELARVNHLRVLSARAVG